MAYHHIQCPHCFTDYTISDEQYHASEGMLRCGTCREQFKAIVVADGTETPKFNPRDVFIEPLSSPLPAAEGGDIELTGEPELSYVSYEKSVDPDDEQNIELMSTHEFEFIEPKEPEVPSEVIEAYGASDELTTAQIIKNLRNKNTDDSFSEGTSDTLELSTTDHQQQLDLELPSISQRSVTQLDSGTAKAAKEATLINQVDQLVDSKLIGKTGRQAAATESATKQTDDFLLAPRKSKRKHKRGPLWFLKTLICLILIFALLAALGYQLWLKQLVDLPRDNVTLNSLKRYIAPYAEQAEEQLAKFDIELPQRRNLSKLALLSAQTEPHPTRSTTVLLKVGLINRAEIAQPLPWLEMTLSDADGRLVARRNLSPKDYIYNNKTNAKIGPNELKKVTIELLSFPKSATGYEIKLLNN